MIKSFIVMLILTILGIYFIKEVTTAMHAIGAAQTFLVTHFDKALTRVHFSRFISCTIVLMIVPFIIGLIPSFVYWVFIQQDRPRVMRIFWTLWLISFVVFSTAVKI